jgi:hypothetical protein
MYHRIPRGLGNACGGEDFVSCLTFIQTLGLKPSFVFVNHYKENPIMNTYHLIAPVLALAGSVFLIVRQENTLDVLRKKTRVVQERLELAATVPARSVDTPSDHRNGEGLPSEESFLLADGSPDWEAVLNLMKGDLERESSQYPASQSPAFQTLLAEMTESEITTGLAKVRGLDLDDQSRQILENILLSHFATKDPKRTLSLIGDLVSDKKKPLSWIQKTAFTALAKKDPVAAMAWLDQQTDAGKLIDMTFYPSENPRFNLERVLIGQLIATDLTNALNRAAALSEEERRHLFSGTQSWKREGKMPVGFLTLARENLSEDRAISAIADAWASNFREDLTSADKALREIPFSEKEKEAVINRSVKNFTQYRKEWNDYESAYQWAARQSPDQAANAIAEALLNGRNSGYYSFDEKFEKSMQLAEKFDNPALITEFARQHNPNRSDQKFENPAFLEKMNELRKALSQQQE